MKINVLKLFGVMSLTTILISGGVFAGSAFADAYDVQYGDIADIARASQWALEEDQGGWAGSNYYENEAWLAEQKSSSRSSRSSSSSSYTPDDYDGDCWWSGRTAHWDSQRSSGEKYQVQLRRGGSEVTTVKTSSTSYDFSSYMKQDGSYKFRVRLVKSNKHGGWGDYSDSKYFEGKSSSRSSSSSSTSSSSSSYSSSGGPGMTVTTGWNRDNRGWWYRFSNGSYARNSWQFINGKWYFFGDDGYMRTGWILWNGVYYYCGPDGAMFTNCYTPDGYYVDGNGAWVR